MSPVQHPAQSGQQQHQQQQQQQSEPEVEHATSWWLIASLTYTTHRCKKRFYVFILITLFTFLNVFLFSKRFLFLKNLGKVNSGKQINEKHFQNNSNEIDIWFFCCMSNIEDFAASLKRRQFLQN